jgi:hypothetical protein
MTIAPRTPGPATANPREQTAGGVAKRRVRRYRDLGVRSVVTRPSRLPLSPRQSANNEPSAGGAPARLLSGRSPKAARSKVRDLTAIVVL